MPVISHPHLFLNRCSFQCPEGPLVRTTSPDTCRIQFMFFFFLNTLNIHGGANFGNIHSIDYCCFKKRKCNI